MTAILLVVTFCLMMQFLWLYIDELVGKGLSLGVIAEFLFWGVCTILPLALPLSTLLSSMMTVGAMAENNELMALKSSGISFARVMAPIMCVCALIAVAAFFVGNNLVPKAYNQIQTLRDDIGRTKDEIKIPAGTFYDGIDGYVLRVDDTDKQTGMMHGVMVYDHSNSRGNTAVTLADSAMMRLSGRKDYLSFILYSGSNYQETNSISYNDTSLALQHLEFDRQEIIIPLSNYSFEKSDSSRFGDQARSMDISRLTHRRDSLRHGLDSLHDIHYENVRKARSFIMGRQLDTASRNTDRSWFDISQLSLPEEHGSRHTVYSRAADNANRTSAEISQFVYDNYDQAFYIRHTEVELYKKFAQALACFLLFFIGAPLGALIRKGELGTSAIISVLFFLLYWVIDISGTNLARDGAVHARIGTFIASIVLAPVGAFFTWKAIRDSSILNMDQFKTWCRKMTSKVVRLFRPVRIVYMGTPEFAVQPLDALIKGGYRVVGVVTAADKPSGRGLKVNESAVKKYAAAGGIPVLQPLKLKDPGFLDSLRALKPDLFVVVAFRMLPQEVWSMPRLGTINLHAALLPQYRGAAPINWAIINGERMSGVTTFMIDKDIDTGGIIARQECRIRPDETAGELHDELMEIGSRLVCSTVEGLIQHNVELRTQKSFIQGSEVLKPAPKIDRQTCTIDWNRSTADIYNLIRGLSPAPAAFTTLSRRGSDEAPQTLRIFRAEKVDMHASPGTVLSDGRTYLAIAAEDGAISVKDIQLAGKKRMDVKAFLLGFRDPNQYYAT